MSEIHIKEFCTLFDRQYLARGLALYRSLERHNGDFRLRALCLDDESERLLGRIQARHLDVISIAELEAHDPELRAVRGTRSPVEYYWTCTPCLCRYLLAREPQLGAITYLDADLMFFDSPAPLFAELGQGSILLIPHRWAQEHRECESTDATSDEAWGKFNVEFMTFRRDANALGALDWWRERCLEFCPALIHPGHFGDQKYLDDWPQRFAGVHVLQHPGGGLAPWNISQYCLEKRGGQILVDGQPLVFHHYQGLWLHEASALGELLARLPTRYRQCQSSPAWIWGHRWPLSREVLELVWVPYVKRLAEAAIELIAVGADPRIGSERLTAGLASARFVKRHLPKHMRRTYWRIRRAARAPAPRATLITPEGH